MRERLQMGRKEKREGERVTGDSFFIKRTKTNLLKVEQTERLEKRS